MCFWVKVTEQVTCSYKQDYKHALKLTWLWLYWILQYVLYTFNDFHCVLTASSLKIAAVAWCHLWMMMMMMHLMPENKEVACASWQGCQTEWKLVTEHTLLPTVIPHEEKRAALNHAECVWIAIELKAKTQYLHLSGSRRRLRTPHPASVWLTALSLTLGERRRCYLCARRTKGRVRFLSVEKISKTKRR